MSEVVVLLEEVTYLEDEEAILMKGELGGVRFEGLMEADGIPTKTGFRADLRAWVRDNLAGLVSLHRIELPSLAGEYRVEVEDV
jgi:hypothetical protein